MRTLFMGTPDFAVPSPETLIAAGHMVCGVFTQPDKPRNRGMKLQAPPVKVCTLIHDIPVYQLVKLWDGAALALIQELAPELIVVAVYDRILLDEILTASPKGYTNAHPPLSLEYRGAAFICWAVLNGDGETGVTIMHMTYGLDADDIITQVAAPIDPDKTVIALHDRLAVLEMELLMDVVADIIVGAATRVPQKHGKVILASMLSRELSLMDWSHPAQASYNQIRRPVPWPAAVTKLDGSRCKVFSVSVLGTATSAAPDTILAAGREGIQVTRGGGTVLCIDELQTGDDKCMKAVDYLQGHPILVE